MAAALASCSAPRVAEGPVQKEASEKIDNPTGSHVLGGPSHQ